MQIRVHAESDEETGVDRGREFGNQDVTRGVRSMTLSDEH
jgi:hypothetical protein